ncbi:MAG: BON domain-containing protein, partial [Bradymonadaceae bacterium]
MMSSAGEFFRRVGPLTMVKAIGGRAEDETGEVTAGTGAVEGTAVEVPDSKIRLDLGMRLEEVDLAGSEVAFRVDDQLVVLKGTVGSYTARDRVEVIAREVRGVRAVENRLAVARKTSSPVGRADGGRE